MWRLIAAGLLVAGLAGGVARVLHAQETSGGTAQRLFDAITALTRRVERMETTTRNVTAFGTWGDGVHDDTAAFVAFRNSFPATGNVHAIIPCGTYLLASTSTEAFRVNVPNLTVEGNGPCTVLKFKDHSVDSRLIGVCSAGSAHDCSGITIKNLVLDGNGANWGVTADCTASGAPYACCTGAGAGTCDSARGHTAIGLGTQGTAVDNVTIENVTIQNFYNAANTTAIAVGIAWAASPWKNLTIKNVNLYDSRAFGISIGCTAAGCGPFTVDGVTVRNGAATLNRAQNVLVASTAALPISGGVIKNVQCQPACTGACIMDQAPNVSIVGNTANGCVDDQIIVTGSHATNVTVTGNTAVGGADGGFGLEAGATADGPSQSTFTGNVSKNNGATGLYMLNTKGDTVSGNVFDGNCTGGVAASCAGLYLVGAVGHTATGNILSNNQYIDTQGVATQKYGVHLITTFTTNNQIDGGRFAGNTTGDYRLDAATGTIISNYNGGSFSIANAPTFTLNGGSILQATLGGIVTPATTGSWAMCSNCTADATCSAGGIGAFAHRITAGPAWKCNG